MISYFPLTITFQILKYATSLFATIGYITCFCKLWQCICHILSKTLLFLKKINYFFLDHGIKLGNLGLGKKMSSLCFPFYEQMANEAKPCPCDIGDTIEYGGLGEEVQIQHIKAYVVKPPASEKAIIVIQDIYGWQLPNTRYMADMLSADGYM